MSTVKRFCIRCKDDRDVDALSFRCLTCGTLTKHVETTGIPPQVAPQTAGGTTVALPSNAATRRWVEQTKAIAEGFAKSAQDARTRATDASAEADRLNQAARAFEGLLKQISLEAPRVAEPNAPKAAHWARQYDACIECGTTTIKHASHGLCRTCDAAKRHGVLAA